MTEDGREILWVSNWMNRTNMRAGYVTLLHLAFHDLEAVECRKRGTSGMVASWILTPLDEEEEPNLTQIPSYINPNRPLDEVRAAYPDTTTLDALGVMSLTMLDNYEIMDDNEAYQTRKVTVNGQEIAVKLVDYYGVPKFLKLWTTDLYVNEWNEVCIYHHLRSVQGRLIPRFLYHGMDFNSIWATAVTTYEGKPLSKVKLTPQIRDSALASLRELHSLGVLLGSIDLWNPVWNGERVMWMNFEQATTKDEVGNFEKSSRREIKDLLELFADLPDETVHHPNPELNA